MAALRRIMPRMRIISRRALREFWSIHPTAKEPLAAWHRVMRSAVFADFNAIRKAFGTADYVAPYTVFDVGGNKYRVIAVIHYNRHRVYSRYVFTHADYDRWSYEQRQRTRKRSKR
jgi:mRNA interferase HigB